jgi:glycosyltransferase involved in cell wall biosynthesis
MAGREAWLVKAIHCYNSQTYNNRELLIVADEGMHVEFSELPEANWHLIHGTYPTLGAKRNAGNAVANGEIIAHFDDDDHSQPGRVTSQVAQLLSVCRHVTGYSGMKFTDGTSWWQYASLHCGYALGTSLCYTKEWWAAHKFDELLNVGEDTEFVDEAVRYRQLAAQPDMDLMYAAIHPGNTSEKDVNKRGQTSYVRLPGFEWRGK